jgi:hypothetical protein
MTTTKPEEIETTQPDSEPAKEPAAAPLPLIHAVGYQLDHDQLDVGPLGERQ